MTKVQMKVTLDDAHVGETDALTKELKTLGIQVETCLPGIGVVFASGEETLLPEVRRLEGVIDAQKEQGYRVPPLSEDSPQ